MSITHVVMLQFNATATPEAIRGIAQQFLDLETACMHPATQQPYVKVRGGKDLSLNPPSASGASHAFLIEFASVEDRAYFIAQDPVHAALVQDVKGLMEKICIVDFVNGAI